MPEIIQYEARTQAVWARLHYAVNLYEPVAKRLSLSQLQRMTGLGFATVHRFANHNRKPLARTVDRIDEALTRWEALTPPKETSE